MGGATHHGACNSRCRSHDFSLSNDHGLALWRHSWQAASWFAGAIAVDMSNPRLGQSALRALFWLIDVVSFGVPLLAIMSDDLRRPIHDRVADSVVVNCKIRNVTSASPSFRDVAIIRGVFWATTSILLFIFCIAAFSFFRRFGSEDALIAQLESQNVLCEQVSDAQSEWPDENGQPASRLSVAMALYSAGVIEPRCLQAEVENLRYSSSEKPLLYLAKSFVYADTPDLSDKYLARVCEMAPKSVECSMSKWIDGVTQGHWHRVKKDLVGITQTNKVYPYIWAIREAMEYNSYSTALTYLNKLPDVHALSDFETPTRVKLLWALDRRREASGAATAAYSSLTDDAKFDVANFMCFENIWSSCGKLQSHSCRTFLHMVNESNDALVSDSASLTYLRAFECKQKKLGRGAIDYAAIFSQPLSDDVRALVSVVQEPGVKGLIQLQKDNTIDSNVAAEATRRWVERISNSTVLAQALRHWQKKVASGRLSLAWRKVGVELFKKYYDNHDYAMSASVGKILLSASGPVRLSASGVAYERRILPLQIISLRRSDQIMDAEHELAVYLAKYPSPEFASATRGVRSPASQDDFAQVVEFLQSNAHARNVDQVRGQQK